MTDQSKAPEDFTKTDAFAAAVNSAVEAAVKKALEGMREFGAMPNNANGAQELLSQLAMTMSEVANQGNPKVTVDPIVMRQRAEAHERMIGLLVDAHGRADAAKQRGDNSEAARWRPRYRVLKPCYLGDRIVDPFRIDTKNKAAIPQEITWSRPPNLSMLPLNDIAERIFREFRTSIGNVEKIKGIADTLMSITAGGLIVHGIALHKRTLGSDDTIDADDFGPDSSSSFSDGLEILTNDDPRNKNRRVLGTIAEGARLPSDIPVIRQ